MYLNETDVPRCSSISPQEDSSHVVDKKSTFFRANVVVAAEERFPATKSLDLNELRKELQFIFSTVIFNTLHHLASLIEFAKGRQLHGDKLSLLEGLSDVPLNEKESEIYGANCVGLARILQRRLLAKGICSYLIPFDGGMFTPSLSSKVLFGHTALCVPSKSTRGDRTLILLDPGLPTPIPLVFPFRCENSGVRNVQGIGYQISRIERDEIFPFQFCRMPAASTGSLKPLNMKLNPLVEWLNPEDSLNRNVLRGLRAFKVVKIDPHGADVIGVFVNFETEKVSLGKGTQKRPYPFCEVTEGLDRRKGTFHSDFMMVCSSIGIDAGTLASELSTVMEHSGKIKSELLSF